MDRVKRFKELIANYCEVKAADMRDDMRFREDLGFSSLDFMSFLGELEDSFDVEVDLEQAGGIHTIGEALGMLDALVEA